MVEWKKLGEISNLVRGKVISKDFIRDHEGEYPVYSSQTANNGVLGYIDSYMFDGDFLTWTTDGAYAGTIFRRNGKFNITNVCGLIKLEDFRINQDFLFYWLSVSAKDYVLEGMGNPKLMSNVASTIKIPVPTLEEQNRIVGILGTFTDSIENLKQQIAQRRKQYAYLIDNFFGGSLSEMKKKAETGTLHVEPLSAHGTFTRGRRFVRTDVVEEGQPCIHYGDMYTYYGLYADKANTHLPYDFPKKMRYAKKGDVVIVGAGENNEDIAVGLVWLGDEPAAVHDACYIYESDFEPMYLSYFLRSSIYHLQIKSHVVRGKICSISSDGIGKALIPIFPMEKQKEIVSKLLPFESLLKNLEAQLAQRQKQYEYYRNQLLTFE